MRRATLNLDTATPFDTEFLSTLSLRRATYVPKPAAFAAGISIHALLAESDPPQSAEIFLAMEISIHALLAESDRPAPRGRRGHADFYPRSPCGERPPTLQTDAPRLIISIHALLAESDVYNFVQQITLHYFYPRSPCGERHTADSICNRTGDFYPRSPCGERQLTSLLLPMEWHFYPRSPCGERRSRCASV